MAFTIVRVTSGGIPVTESATGFPYYEADNGFGIPVTFGSTGIPLGTVSKYGVFDTFSRYADSTVMAGQVPQIGPAWGTSGANVPTISGGKLVCPAAGVSYLYDILPAVPMAITAEFDFTGGADLTQKELTIAFCNDATFTINDTLHLNFGPLAWTLIIRQAGGAFNIVLGDNWVTPMSNDGATHAVTLQSVGNQCSITGPSGEIWSFTDSRIPSVVGTTVFWEPAKASDGLKSEVSKAYAYKAGGTTFSYTNYAPFNPADQVNMNLSNGNCQATAAASATNNQVRTVSSNQNSKVYFEVRCQTIFNAASTNIAVGVSNASMNLSTTRVGGDLNGFGWVLGSSAQFFINGAIVATVATGGVMQADQGDVLAFAIDFGAKKTWFKNITKGTGWNNDVIGNQNPATGTGGQSFASINAGPYFITQYSFQIANSFWLNTGELPYKGSAPAGFSNWLS